jgi:O-antigen/teichoic acid export membrane protein
MISRKGAGEPPPTGDSGDVAASTDSPVPGNSIRRNLVMLAGGQAATWTMALLWTLVVPRLLGPTALGVLTSAGAVTSVLGLFVGLGTVGYLTREISARPDSAGHLVGTALVLRLVMAPLFVATVAGFAHAAHYGATARLVLWLATAATLFKLLAEPISAAFQARERMEYSAYSDVIGTSAICLGGIAVVVIGLGVVGLVTVGLVVAITVLLLDVRWIRQLVHLEIRTTARQLTTLVRSSVPFFALGVFSLIYLWIDTIMLSVLTRQEVVGWYSVPTEVFSALLFIPSIIGGAWLPRLVRAFESSESELRAMARAPIELTLVLSLPVCAATTLAARPLILILWGNAYRKSVPVMAVLGLALVPIYATVIFGTVLTAMRWQGRLTYLMIGAALVNPALNAFFIPFTEHRYHNGAIGAAICMLLTELLVVTVELIWIGRRLLSSSSLLRVTRAALASGGMWAVGYLARHLGWYVSLPLAGMTFLLLAWLLHLAGPLEIEAIQSGLAKVTSRLRRVRQAPTTK